MNRLESFLRLMSTYGVGELEMEDREGRIHLRMQGVAPSAGIAPSAPAIWTTPALPSPSATQAPAAAPSLKESAPVAALPSNQKKMLSPFVGTFYRASNPNAEPYVKEGQTVRKGQTLCIIEAMKLMNEIESDFDGKIVSALVENGQPVEFGEPLFIIEA